MRPAGLFLSCSSVASRRLLALPSRCRRGLDRACLARLHVVPAPAELTEQAGFLQFPLEHLERALQAILVAQPHLCHGPTLLRKRGGRRSASPPRCLKLTPSSPPEQGDCAHGHRRALGGSIVPPDPPFDQEALSGPTLQRQPH